jgi:hypothetical protein
MEFSGAQSTGETTLWGKSGQSRETVEMRVRPGLLVDMNTQSYRRLDFGLKSTPKTGTRRRGVGLEFEGISRLKD